MDIQEIIDEAESLMSNEDCTPQQVAELINQLAKRVQDLEQSKFGVNGSGIDAAVRKAKEIGMHGGA